MGARLVFVDSSVLIAILAEEPDRDHFLRQLEAAGGGVTSPLVVLETTMRLSSILQAEPARTEEEVLNLLEVARIVQLPIIEQDGSAAIEAFGRYGKGRRHPAQLNMADCMAYACARNRGLKLLYKGNDFAATDLA